MNATPSRTRRLLRLALIGIAAAVFGYLSLIALVHPSNVRDWSPDQARTATATIDGDRVRVSNVRNAVYRSTQDFDVHWETRELALRRLESVWYVAEPFADWRGPAHAFLSFGFGQGQYLAVSVEIRKERGESFSPLKGLLRQYELAYIIGDERDLIGLRANHRQDEVYLYPIRATPAQARALLVSMLERANAIAAKPEFYNTLTNTCTSNIVDHIESIAPVRIPFSFKTLLPAYSDDLAFELGLIDTALGQDNYRGAHKINDLAREFADHPDFSDRIRTRIRR